MLQSPYSTGIFLTRKYIDINGRRFMDYVTTDKDMRLSGNSIFFQNQGLRKKIPQAYG